MRYTNRHFTYLLYLQVTNHSGWRLRNTNGAVPTEYFFNSIIIILSVTRKTRSPLNWLCTAEYRNDYSSYLSDTGLSISKTVIETRYPSIDSVNSRLFKYSLSMQPTMLYYWKTCFGRGGGNFADYTIKCIRVLLYSLELRNYVHYVKQTVIC